MVSPFSNCGSSSNLSNERSDQTLSVNSEPISFELGLSHFDRSFLFLLLHYSHRINLIHYKCSETLCQRKFFALIRFVTHYSAFNMIIVY